VKVVTNEVVTGGNRGGNTLSTPYIRVTTVTT
jgi:hypothetical protein